MRAWQVTELGQPRDVLRLVDVADPEPGPGQLAVAVLAAPANFPDVLMCRGNIRSSRSCRSHRAWSCAAR
nr:hypothetical protein GCM10020092_079530 [Actinoplanes digitatis]